MLEHVINIGLGKMLLSHRFVCMLIGFGVFVCVILYHSPIYAIEQLKRE